MYWIKLYLDTLYDHTMGNLPDHLWRRAIELNILAGGQDDGGLLPSLSKMAWSLRTSEARLTRDLQDLARLGIVDQCEQGWFVTGFSERQAPSKSTERVRKFRQKQAAANAGNNRWNNAGNVSRNALEREIESESESESETETESDLEGEGEGEEEEWEEEEAEAEKTEFSPSLKSPSDNFFNNQFSEQPPTVKDYCQLTGLKPTALQARSIAAEAASDPRLWRETIEHWLMHGWKANNVSGILDLFRRGGPAACSFDRAPASARPSARPQLIAGRLAAERARLAALRNDLGMPDIPSERDGRWNRNGHLRRDS